MKNELWLKDYPRPIKVFQVYSYSDNRVKTLDGTKRTDSENVRYENIKELLAYSFEGIMGALALTHMELLFSNEDDEGYETSNIAEIISEY